MKNLISVASLFLGFGLLLPPSPDNPSVAQVEGTLSQSASELFPVENTVQTVVAKVEDVSPIAEDSIPHLTIDDLQCVDGNVAKLSEQVQAQAEAINGLTQEVSRRLNAEAQSPPKCKCDCNCPTVEEIADAVEARLKPLLVVRNQTTGATRKIAVSPDAPFDLAPGEILAGVERVAGSGVIVPVSNGVAVPVQGVSQPVTQYSIAGWDIRTTQSPRGGLRGQVRQTCRQVWNPITNRFERQCNQ